MNEPRRRGAGAGVALIDEQAIDALLAEIAKQASADDDDLGGAQLAASPSASMSGQTGASASARRRNTA